MFQQVIDFRDESDALYRLLEPLEEADFDRKTQFKGWSINDVLGHLHIWNWAADKSLNDEAAFQVFLGKVMAAVVTGGIKEFEREYLGELRGRALLEEWHGFYLGMSERFGAADPRARVKWAGPDMSVRSSITARLMETWAHGHEVFDLLGVERQESDRIKNIVTLGINTFGWTYANRKLDVPGNPPHVRLTAPSGETWEWNPPSEDNLVEGSAVEFCQVVTQARNIADTGLKAVGDTASEWMAMAQCFAGPPMDPPAPGTRFRAGSANA